MKRELIAHSEWVTQRTVTRLEGLTDDEYTWTPVDGAWHLRAVGPHQIELDLTVPMPEPPPFTTLAWRLYHLCGTYAMERNAEWLNLEPQANPAMASDMQPVDAASALRLVERSIEVWFQYLHDVTEETLREPLGDKAGFFGESNGADYVLHQIDEHIHHGAEVALLRDLYRVTTAS